MKLQGTDKQVAYANDLINDFLEPLQNRVAKLENKGFENLNEKQKESYKERKTWIDAVENMTIENAGKIISLFQNVMAGGWDINSFKEATQK